MELKYVRVDYYYGSEGSPISSMTFIANSVMPVIIADGETEYSSLSGNEHSLSGPDLALYFTGKTGYTPNSITMPAFFSSEESFIGYSTYGSYMPLPNLIGYPINASSDIICLVGDYYYKVVEKTASQVPRSSPIYNKDGSLFSNFNIPCCGSYNNTTSDRAQSQFIFIRKMNNAIDRYKNLSYSLTSASSGTYNTYNNGSNVNVLTVLNSLVYIDPVVPDTDPYSEGGNTDVGGGTGTFSDTGDNVDFPDNPTLSASNTSFITLFNPTASELRNLANYMWSNPLFDLDAWKKIFANPMDAILGLSIVPVAVPNGGSSVVTVGNIQTGISMTKAGSQFVTVDCGSLNIQEFWGAYLDYDPYTKAEIYLPYIGTHPLAVDDIMGKTIHVVYHVDILSGACCAYIKCNDSVLYSFVGQCSCSIPITGNDWTNVINGALSIAASIGNMVATGGMSAPLSLGNIASTAINSMKPNVEKSGSMSGMGGMLGIQTPYLIITRPRQALPQYQNKFTGYPSFVTMSLGSCTGYTEIDSIHLENIPATQDELNEIEALLKGGVLF